jgi:hypothetical protein
MYNFVITTAAVLLRNYKPTSDHSLCPLALNLGLPVRPPLSLWPVCLSNTSLTRSTRGFILPR